MTETLQQLINEHGYEAVEANLKALKPQGTGCPQNEHWDVDAKKCVPDV
jgi:hypothetical protein